MATIFNVRNLKMPSMSRASVIIGTLVVILALVAAFAGWHLYKKLTTNTVVAYFPDTPGLYPGDKVQIMGVRVGSIDKIEPAGDKMKVTFHYDSKYKVPASATATILFPSLVASRPSSCRRPTPAGRSGGRRRHPDRPHPAAGRVRRAARLDQPDPHRPRPDPPQQPKGPFGDVIESFADGLAGKGQQINTTLNSLSEALTTLNEGRGDFFAVVKSLALFVNALYSSDQQFVALNNDLAQFTDSFTNTDRELATALQDLNQLLATTRRFLDENGEVLTKDVNNLADVTNAILQPEPRVAWRPPCTCSPTSARTWCNITAPNAGGIVGLPVINSFANPMQFLCSAIQAGSRLGYQDSAELCAQYLAPILDAIKFNYLPFGLNQLRTAMTLPKQIAYSRPEAAAATGIQGHHRAGICSRDTLFSHGNHEPGWIVAPGMQGVDVQPFTANMLTPESLSELMGGPDIVAPPAPPRSG